MSLSGDTVLLSALKRLSGLLCLCPSELLIPGVNLVSSVSIVDVCKLQRPSSVRAICMRPHPCLSSPRGCIQYLRGPTRTGAGAEDAAFATANGGVGRIVTLLVVRLLDTSPGRRKSCSASVSRALAESPASCFRSTSSTSQQRVFSLAT